jgi:hypothetical protein
MGKKHHLSQNSLSNLVLKKSFRTNSPPDRNLRTETPQNNSKYATSWIYQLTCQNVEKKTFSGPTGRSLVKHYKLLSLKTTSNAQICTACTDNSHPLGVVKYVMDITQLKKKNVILTLSNGLPV